MSLQDSSFEFLRDMLLAESGLVITPEKVYLLESRLLPIANKRGLEGLEGLVSVLRLGSDKGLQYEVVEAMTTNETSFYRDSTPFDRLKENILPFVEKNRSNRRIRIWCAACSSGQEPYSIAMLLKEHPVFSSWNIDILATDLSEEILAQAKNGVYSQFEVQRGLPIQMLVKYFTQDGDKWKINDSIKSMINYRKANLLTDIRTVGEFDIIFCRNVLIYFDADNKRKVFSDMKQVLTKDGVLFLGGAETVIGISDDFKPVSELKGVYVRDDSTFTPIIAN